MLQVKEGSVYSELGVAKDLVGEDITVSETSSDSHRILEICLRALVSLGCNINCEVDHWR
jgi:hypothetical protein